MKILEDFVVNRKAKHERSKLYAQKEQIFELARRNYSSYAIVEFLALVGVETTRKNVDNFLKRHKNKINKQGAAPARAPQSPALAGVNSKEKIGAEARAEAENPNIIRGYGGVKIDTTHPLYIQLQKNKNKGNTDD